MLGSVVCATGVAAIALSLWMRRQKEWLLLSWGTFGILWGAYLLARTPAFESDFAFSPVFWAYLIAFLVYLLPIPVAGCLVGIFGKGKRGLFVWLLRVAALFAACAMIADVVQASPGSAIPAGRVFGVVFGLAIVAGVVWAGIRITGDVRVFGAGFVVGGLSLILASVAAGKFLPLNADETGIGVLVVLLAVGYTSLKRFFVNLKERFAGDIEMESARQIQFTLIPQELPQTQNLRVATRYVPANLIGGNFIDCVPSGDGTVSILLGDVSAHGVGAAALASILRVSFASQISREPDPGGILTGMNRMLGERTEHRSAAASCLVLHPGRRAMTYSNAGHPPLLIWRKGADKFEEVGGSGVALGPMEDARFANVHLPFDGGDRIILYTKGVTEALDPRGRMFGEKRFRYLLRSDAKLGTEESAEAITQHLLTWTGVTNRGVLKDDMTLVIIDVMGNGSA